MIQIEYFIAQKEQLPKILELYKQLLSDETPLDINKANETWEIIEKNNVKYFIAMKDNKIVQRVICNIHVDSLFLLSSSLFFGR